MQPGQTVRTFTGRTGTVQKICNAQFPEAARVVVAVPLRIEGGKPIVVRCHYHPADLTADCPPDCPDECPTHSH